MTLQYLREYKVQYYIRTNWRVSESKVCCIIQKAENVLIRSRVFSLPGKELRQREKEERVVVIDVTESPIEKPKEGQKRFYSGKQGEHTLNKLFFYLNSYFKTRCYAISDESQFQTE